MEKGPVSVHARLRTERRTGLMDANVWGTLPGTTNEDIVIMAQHDARFEGAFSNASGVATMLGLAEYFAKIPAANRRRTLRFVSTAAGGAQLMHQNRATLLANTALIINCQHTSAIQFIQYEPPEGTKYPEQGGLDKTQAVNARQFWIYGSDRLAGIIFDSLAHFGVALWDYAMNDGSGLGVVARDAPSLQTLVTPVYFSSDHDRPEFVPPSGGDGWTGLRQDHRSGERAEPRRARSDAVGRDQRNRRCTAASGQRRRRLPRGQSSTPQTPWRRSRRRRRPRWSRGLRPR